MRTRKDKNRGIVLLVVLSMLVIFTLMAVTFVVVSGHYRRGSLAFARYGRLGNPPRATIETALKQLVRGPRDSRSSLAGQSLLRDFYGNDGLVCTVTRARTIGVGHLLYINYLAEPAVIQPFGTAVNTSEDYYNGRVVTFLNTMWHGGTNRVFNGPGTPGSDDRLTLGHRWAPGGDGAWGNAGVDDNGDGVVDDRWEAGWVGSDDVLMPGAGQMITPGNDGGWGRAGIDDDGNGSVDDSAEAGWPTSDDGYMPSPGFSVRVLDSGPGPGGSGWLVVEIPESDIAPNSTILGQRLVPALGTRFLINGAPFNGTGVGAHSFTRGAVSLTNLDNGLVGPDGQPGVAGVDDDGDGTTDGAVPGPGSGELGWPGSDDYRFALLPHLARYTSTAQQASAVQGGSDESYDTFDFQNMFLAMVPPELNSVPEIIPSFHRPALVNYWYTYALVNLGLGGEANPRAVFADVRGAATMTGPQRQALLQLKRQFIFRPLIEDHPNFTGGNPSFSLWGNQFGGTWDVDNDGDGVADSIWIDIGLPAETGEDGRLYRPLIAFLVRDLDGSLNLNAHDNTESLAAVLGIRWKFHPGPDGEWGVAGVDDDGNGIVDDIADAGPGPVPVGDDVRMSSFTNPGGAPRGLGTGPAEVSLFPLARGLAAAASETQNLVAGRYGPTPVPGRVDGQDDPLHLVKLHDVPQAYPWTPGIDGAWGVAGVDDDGDSLTDNVTEAGWPGSDDRYADYGSPPDGRGIGTVLLDYAGQPVMAHMGQPGETTDDPYEIAFGNLDFGKASGADRPFTMSELERLLRFYDVDAATLPSRLLRLAPTTFASEASRRRVTVLSSHVPVINVGIPQAFRNSIAANTAPTIRDLYVQRFLQGGVPAAQIQTNLSLVFPLEFYRGEQFDLNRRIGNGRDDNGNRVVDEPWEVNRGEPAWQGSPVVTRHDNDVRRMYLASGVNANWTSRHMYARQLFCLLMLLVDPYQPGAYVHPTVEGLTVPQRQELMVRRLAQWAVNVVDFRDNDSIMTGFEYDVNPFNGWNVDGWIGKTPGPDGAWGVAGVDDDGNGLVDDIADAGVGAALVGDDTMSSDDTHVDRRVVWGLEYPELLFSESVATHDRRVKDVTFDDGDNDVRFDGTSIVDDDLDQYRLPQGSLFLELYCPKPRFANTADPRFPNQPTVGEELYVVNRALGTSFLDVGRMAPPGNGRRYPVWRVAISEPHLATLNTVSSPLVRSASNPDSTSFSADNMDLLAALRATPPALQDLAIERIIWFATVNPTSVGFAANNGTPDPTDDPERIYWNRLPNRLIPAGGYAVVGPRVETRIGSQIMVTPPTTTIPTPSNQRIRLEPGPINPRSVAMWRNDNATGNPDTPDPTRIKPAIPMIAAANPPADWANASRTADLGLGGPTGIGINVSEPVPFDAGRYYPEPTTALGAGLPVDSWYDATTQTGIVPDEPFDSRDPTVAPYSTWPLNQDPTLRQTGVKLDYKTAFLQRLADPLQPYHPQLNPYITIDYIPIDLTVFNGEDQEPAGWDSAANGPFDPDDPAPPADPPFETRERAGANQNVWAQVFAPPTNNWVPVGALDYFEFNLTHTLGWLNFALDNGGPRAVPPNPPAFAGDPSTGPFPWLAWNNRPFASPLELTLVPASSPSRLCFEHSLFNSGANAYDASTPTNVPELRAPFSHLLNFYHGIIYPFASPPNPGANRARFYELLDYVGTRSDFVGTDRWYPPTVFANSGVMQYPSPVAPTAPFFPYRPPFNRVSTFREPGRVNINTMPYYWSPGGDGGFGQAGIDDNGNGSIDDPWEAGWPGSDDVIQSRVWEGLTKNFPLFDPTTSSGATVLRNLLFSRRGIPSSPPDPLNNPRGNPQNPLGFNIDITRPFANPTRFGNPFRTAASADLMPRLVDPATNPLDYLPKDGVEATLMRPWIDPSSGTVSPLFGVTSTSPLNDPSRNPFFAYQGVSRLANLITTHSNVFAVWITVGYFELEPNPGGADIAHPDGYRLGRERGELTGEVERHRGFFIIDRSIPTAFEPGEDHNIERAILLHRIIE